MTYTDHGGSLYSLEGFSPNERAKLVALRSDVVEGVLSDWPCEYHAALLCDPTQRRKSAVPGWAIARWLRRLEAWLAWDYERQPDRPADADGWEDGGEGYGEGRAA